MAESDKTIEQTQVHCKVCLKEVPRNEAESAEVHDYVMYFCGLECYEEWQNGGQEQKSAAVKIPPASE